MLFPDVKIYRSLPELLKNPEIELVIVNVPDHIHASYCKAALEAGKHVVVEKPLTLTVSEGQDLIDLAESLKLGLFIFQNRRWDSDFLTVKNLIDSGKLGRIVEYEAHYDRFRETWPRTTIQSRCPPDRSGPGIIRMA